MPQHRVDLTLPTKPVDIGNGDTRLSIYADKVKLGNLDSPEEESAGGRAMLSTRGPYLGAVRTAHGIGLVLK